ncbi:MAG: hypothetical protein C5B58_10950 [Acidobacteria bacterium]|nr:MAG: hypothetical protein C5B58_10950 [Acidobacteriota bacterium]
MKCTAHKSNGQPCNASALAGTNVCHVHGGFAPQVKRKARERLLEAADPAAARLVWLLTHGETHAVQRAAATDILDRAGFKPSTELSLASADGVDRLSLKVVYVDSPDKDGEDEIGSRPNGHE